MIQISRQRYPDVPACQIPKVRPNKASYATETPTLADKTIGVTSLTGKQFFFSPFETIIFGSFGYSFWLMSMLKHCYEPSMEVLISDSNRPGRIEMDALTCFFQLFYAGKNIFVTSQTNLSQMT